MAMSRRIGLIMVVVAGLGMGACQQTLFTHSDSYLQTRIKRYYDDDSAVQRRAERADKGGTEYGMPTGMAEQ